MTRDGARGGSTTGLDLYRELARARAIEEVVMRLADERRFQGFYHPGNGQEAMSVGACAAMRDDDAMFYAHRGLGYLTAKGMDPVEILGDFVGTVAGSTRGLGAGTVHCVDPDRGIYGQGGTLGSCFPLATGAALGYQLSGRDSVAVAFFGDGASARGTFLESAVVAIARQLPVVYICENNGLAVSVTPQESQGTDRIAPRAEGFGIPTASVDGADVFAVHDAVSEAIDRARAGGGPSFVEATARRGSGHYAGDLQPYRSDRDEEGEDPLDRAAAALREQGVAQSALEDVMTAARNEMEEALAIAAAAELPGEDRLFEGVWT